MSNITSLDDHRPHITGPAICCGCGYRWIAVAPVGTSVLQCPECEQLKGVTQGLIEPDVHFACACGCYHFAISPERIMCVNCGEEPILT